MISDSAFEQLKDRFSTSSWAVWSEDEDDVGDERYVVLVLNPLRRTGQFPQSEPRRPEARAPD